MTPNLRLPKILELLRRDGAARVEDLATRLDVTAQTIRRDLAELADAGAVERVHGGAVLRGGGVNLAYAQRRALAAEAKAAIARACAAEIAPDCTLFLNIGTTTEAVAQELAGHGSLRIFTNNTNIAAQLAMSAEVVLTGGQLRASDGGLVGPLAVQAVQALRPDLAVIGCSGIETDGELMDFDLAEVAVSQAIIARARQVWVVADATKMHRSAPARIGTLAQVARLYTDAPLAPELAALCRQWGTRVITAPADSPPAP